MTGYNASVYEHQIFLQCFSFNEHYYGYSIQCAIFSVPFNGKANYPLVHFFKCCVRAQGLQF